MTKLSGQITVLDVNVDDLQSGMEATSRIAVALQRDAIKLDRTLARQLQVAHAVGAVVHQTRQLMACLKEQRSALKELRENVAQLRATLNAERSRSAARRSLPSSPSSPASSK